MDQGYLIGAVFIDLGKAFDTVDHELLLEKLREYDLEGIELGGQFSKSRFLAHTKPVFVTCIRRPPLLRPRPPPGGIWAI